MRRVGACLAMLGLMFSAQAQLTVEVTSDQDQYLNGEPLMVTVRVTNRSGQTLKLGTDNSWLTFTIEQRDGVIVPLLGEVPVMGEFLLETSKRAKKDVDLAPYFAIDKTGRFLITATVHVKEWGKQISSEPHTVDVIEGVTLWEREIGLPNSRDTNGPPEMRRYMLQQSTYLKGRMRLFLKVVDSGSGRTLRLLPIGNLISFSRPDPQIDSESNLHLVYQTGPQTFSYLKFDPDGKVLLRQTHDFGDSRPRLKIDPAGNITIAGGLRREMPTDIPAPADEPGVTPAPAAADPKPEPPKAN